MTENVQLCCCEVIVIDIRKFLTELGKLLTFMYEEDRVTALSMFEEMFRTANDPVALLQMLGSPTKQAVAIARVYNAKEHKLAVTSQEGAGEAAVATSELPPFVAAINSIKEEAILKNILDGGISPEEEAFFADVPQDDTFLFGEEDSLPAPAEESAPADPFAILQDFTLDLPDEAADFIASAARLDATGSDAEKEPELPEEEFSFQEDEFQFDLGPVPEKQRSDASDINEAMAAFRRRKAEPQPVLSEEKEQTRLPEFDDLPAENDHPWKKQPEKKADSSVVSIPRMILYLLIAVPVTALGVLILLIPAVICLALSVVCGMTAFQVIAAAFGNFAVFADIMVVLGAALAFVALTLLFFWLFIWFIAGAIAGLINVSIRLGGKICYREDKA